MFGPPWHRGYGCCQVQEMQLPEGFGRYSQSPWISLIYPYFKLREKIHHFEYMEESDKDNQQTSPSNPQNDPFYPQNSPLNPFESPIMTFFYQIANGILSTISFIPFLFIFEISLGGQAALFPRLSDGTAHESWVTDKTILITTKQPHRMTYGMSHISPWQQVTKIINIQLTTKKHTTFLTICLYLTQNCLVT